MPATRRSLLQQPFLSLASTAACVPDDPAPVPSLAAHAAYRLQFGPLPGDVARIESIGYPAFLAEQLNPAALNDSACDAILATFEHEAYLGNWQQLYDIRNLSESTRPFYQVRHRTLARMIYSKRQLFERMVNFWFDHFNIYGRDYIVRSLFTKWDEMIRVHALGNFREFLEAVAKHPCMLNYLDNYLNTNAGPNENFARECCELHTLGAEHYRTYLRTDPEYDPSEHYIDADVYGIADCFTGWTYEGGSSEPNRGEYEYRDASHNRGFKIVLGEVFEPDGPPEDDGQRVLDLLANHAGTARHIAWKLCRRFISDDPPDSIVTTAAAVFAAAVDAPDQIKQTLQHILESAEFQAEEARAAKMTRPLDWTIATHRALEIPYTSEDAFFWLYDPIGQPIFQWRPPNGAPEDLSYWATSNGFLQRINLIYPIASGWYVDEGIDFDAEAATPPEIQTPREIADYWVQRVVQRPVSPATEAGLIEFVAEGRNWDQPMPASERTGKLKFVAALCTLTPEFQRK